MWGWGLTITVSTVTTTDGAAVAVGSVTIVVTVHTIATTAAVGFCHNQRWRWFVMIAGAAGAVAGSQADSEPPRGCLAICRLSDGRESESLDRLTSLTLLPGVDRSHGLRQTSACRGWQRDGEGVASPPA